MCCSSAALARANSGGLIPAGAGATGERPAAAAGVGGGQAIERKADLDAAAEESISTPRPDRPKPQHIPPIQS